MKLTFGKYKDQEIEDIPTSYLEWMEINNTDLWRIEAQKELRRRTSSRSSEGKTIKVSRD